MTTRRRQDGGPPAGPCRAWRCLLAAGLLPPTGAAAIPGPPPESREQAESCLAQAISYEAGTEPEAGQEAVAQVVLNRLRAAGYPKTVCGVVYEGSERRTGCQFTFTCDGSLARRRPANWDQAMRIARGTLDGTLASGIGDATHYHASYVQPAWAARMTRVARIGAHIFYTGGDASGAIPPPALPAVPPARPVDFSAWGIRTAVLLPGRGGVTVAPVPSPPSAPGTADRAFP